MVAILFLDNWKSELKISVSIPMLGIQAPTVVMEWSYTSIFYFSVGSLLLPVYWEDEETETDVTPLDVRRDKIFHIGFYVDSASLALKLTERHKEKSLFGSTKMRFSPFLRLDLSGLVHEAIIKGIHTVNVTGGISEICLVPVGDCLCGARDTALATSGSSETNTETKYLYAGSPAIEGKRRR